MIFIQPPVGKYDKVTPLSFLHIEKYPNEGEDEYDARVSRMVNAVLEPIAGDQKLYARMKRVLKVLVQLFLDLDEDYTLVSVHKILIDEDIRQGFIEELKERDVDRADEVIDELEMIDEDIEQEDLEPLLGRVMQWVLDRTARKTVAHPTSTFDMVEAIENGKIIVCDPKENDISSDVAVAIASVLAHKLWDAIRHRYDPTSSDALTPFFLATDELDDAFTYSTPIPSMISNARKFRLGLLLASQYPGQLSVLSDQDTEAWEDAILNQVGTIIAGRNSEQGEAEKVCGRFEGIKPEDISNLDDHTGYVKTTTADGQSDPIKINTFPPAPPIRTRREVEEDIIEPALDRYGVDPSDAVAKGESMVEQVVSGEVSLNTGVNGIAIETDTMLAAIDAVGIQAGAVEADYGVRVTAVANEIRNRANLAPPTADDGVTDQALERIIVEELPESYVRTEIQDDDVIISLTEAGRQKTRDVSSGRGGSAGGALHHQLALDVRDYLTAVGFDVDVVDQYGGGEEPDLVATPPQPEISISGDARPVTEIADEHDLDIGELLDSHPGSDSITDELWQVAGPEPSDVYVEVEQSTDGAQTLQNLSKAVEDDARCVFVVGSEEKLNTTLTALQNPPYHKRAHTPDAACGLYTSTNPLHVESTVQSDSGEHYWRALKPSDAGRTRWDLLTTDDSTWIDPSDPDTDPRLRLTFSQSAQRSELPLQHFRNAVPRSPDLPAWGGKDPETGTWKVFTPTDSGIEQEVFDSRSDMSDKYSEIKDPFRPVHEFDRRPTVDDWAVLSLPEAEADQDAPVLHRPVRPSPSADADDAGGAVEIEEIELTAPSRPERVQITADASVNSGSGSGDGAEGDVPSVADAVDTTQEHTDEASPSGGSSDVGTENIGEDCGGVADGDTDDVPSIGGDDGIEWGNVEVGESSDDSTVDDELELDAVTDDDGESTGETHRATDDSSGNDGESAGNHADNEAVSIGEQDARSDTNEGDWDSESAQEEFDAVSDADIFDPAAANNTDESADTADTPDETAEEGESTVAEEKPANGAVSSEDQSSAEDFISQSESSDNTTVTPDAADANAATADTSTDNAGEIERSEDDHDDTDDGDGAPDLSPDDADTDTTTADVDADALGSEENAVAENAGDTDEPTTHGEHGDNSDDESTETDASSDTDLDDEWVL
ncbi:hypothetical protein [Halovenus sp. HT40]|uniref:hypothetical protein n=1 Tax=Halovenus sp. HT40 TaxID=3126691 RepID=UPI00300E92F2